MFIKDATKLFLTENVQHFYSFVEITQSSSSELAGLFLSVNEEL